MNDTPSCARCGAELLAGGGLEGLCPRCLLVPPGERGELGAAEGDTVGTAVGHLHDMPVVRALFPELDVLDLIGRGGMGVVYRARQRRLDRLVALKLLAPELADDPAFAERFGREARALARLSHPHIVAVHDFGEREGVFYLLLEYVEGAGLRRVMSSGDLRPQEALAIVPQICAGLQYAHERGVVHRDVKPENILLDAQGKVKIADFGLAKLVAKEDRDAPLTRTSQVMGTPHYMAPEQLTRPLDVDHRADIYSLGVVLYEMLTGELPLGRFDPPSQRVELDVRLDRVVLRALEREPEQRYQRASDVGTDIEGIAGGARGPRNRANEPRADANEGDGLRWVAAVPGGPPVVALTALAAAWFWGLFLVLRDDLARVEMHAVAYPLAFVALRAARMWRPGQRSGLLRPTLITLAALAAVAALAAACGDDVTDGLDMALTVVASILALGAGLMIDRWLRWDGWQAFLVAAALMILATVLQAAHVHSPSRGAYYFASGITALLSAGALVALLPEFALGNVPKLGQRALLRALVLGGIAAVFYFHRQIF